ncbi:unnamed protein product [Fusarium graminearum]|uniref:Uncharacterized protein n=1 Tax=Gibberella zeae TaxID=5518 RepID=A0A4E9DNM4_GIBZA|nr:unnamed protein product [Fusarium graminearum]
MGGSHHKVNDVELLKLPRFRYR